MSDRFTTLPNGAVYDTVKKQIVKPSAMPQEALKSPDTAKKSASSSNSSKSETNSPKTEKSQKRRNAGGDGVESHVSHTVIAREILAYNRTHKADKTNVKWLEERGFWYFDRCIEEGVSPTAMGLVLALGFKQSEQNLLLSGNSGLPLECRELIAEFKQALEMTEEGALVDNKAGQAGRIFALKNRYGWTDNGNAVVESEQKFGEIKSPEELRKALAKMPNLDLIDEPKVVDVDFEVVEG